MRIEGVYRFRVDSDRSQARESYITMKVQNQDRDAKVANALAQYF